MGKLNRDEGVDISRSDFDKGYAFYAFDLTADLSEDDHYNLIKQNVRLSLKYATPLDQPVMVITLAKFDNLLEINRDRQIFADFGL